MIGYTTLGTKDVKAAAAFYDELLGVLGAQRVMEDETFVVWGNAPSAPLFCVTLPYDGREASVGNGVMIALAASNQSQVDELYAKALSLGATNEGDPGVRQSGFYCGYFRDPDGNKLNVHCQ